MIPKLICWLFGHRYYDWYSILRQYPTCPRCGTNLTKEE